MRRPVGVKGIRFGICWSRCFLPSRVATVATLPSALFDERFVSLGASWVFWFQPVMPPVIDLGSISKMKAGQAINPVTELGFRLWLPFAEGFGLCSRRHRSLLWAAN